MELLQQALEALELSAPLPGYEERWSEAINALYAAKDGKALAVPAGYVLVPTEPTDEMLDVYQPDRDEDVQRLRFANTYKAMIAAAQQEPRK